MHLVIMITAMTLSGTPDARTLLKKSNRAAEIGRVAEAADLLEHHLTHGTSNSPAAKHAAEQLAALAQLERSAPPAESKANVLVKEGEVYLKYGLPDKGEASFKAALALEPGHAGALEGLKTTSKLAREEIDGS